MLSKAIALRKESMSPYTLPPMEESEITQPSVSCPGSRTKLEPLSSPLGSPKQLSSPKPVVAECENCKKKFYSRYPTSMHISSCCSKGKKRLVEDFSPLHILTSVYYF